jgi:hypothetical protein
MTRKALDLRSSAAKVLKAEADKQFADLKASFAEDMLAAFRDRDKTSGLGLAFGVTAKFAAQVAKFYSSQSDARVAVLEGRLAQLEQQMGDGAALKYGGVYQRPLSYRKGSVVTMNGSAWVALKDAPAGSQPGDGQTWQLMVKRGRDAKNLTQERDSYD